MTCSRRDLWKQNIRESKSGPCSSKYKVSVSLSLFIAKSPSTQSAALGSGQQDFQPDLPGEAVDHHPVSHFPMAEICLDKVNACLCAIEQFGTELILLGQKIVAEIHKE